VSAASIYVFNVSSIILNILPVKKRNNRTRRSVENVTNIRPLGLTVNAVGTIFSLNNSIRIDNRSNMILP
jgi:hypothetical protein